MRAQTEANAHKNLPNGMTVEWRSEIDPNRSVDFTAARNLVVSADPAETIFG